MANIAYLNKKSHMSHSEIMALPFRVYLLYLKHHFLMDLRETPEGREKLEKYERMKITSPDLSKIRKLTGYKKVGDGQ